MWQWHYQVMRPGTHGTPIIIPFRAPLGASGCLGQPTVLRYYCTVQPAASAFESLAPTLDPSLAADRKRLKTRPRHHGPRCICAHEYNSTSKPSHSNLTPLPSTCHYRPHSTTHLAAPLNPSLLSESFFTCLVWRRLSVCTLIPYRALPFPPMHLWSLNSVA